MSAMSRPVNGSFGEKAVGKRIKPPKPYPEFPLYAHAAGVWAKRIRGRMYYFGPWGDPDGALERFLKARDALYAGRPPPPEVEGITLDELANRFLASKLLALQAGEIGPRQYFDYRCDAKRLLEVLGRRRPVLTLDPTDFARLRVAVAQGRNATTVTNIITRLRSIFTWGYVTRLLAQPVLYGGEFRRPSARALRKARTARGLKLFSAEEVRQLLQAAEALDKPSLRAMILLGINGGLTNSDCAGLRWGHVDLAMEVLDFPRPKTEIQRRAVLWSQTVQALREVQGGRAAADPQRLVFTTRTARPCLYITAGGSVIDAVGAAFGRLRRRAGLVQGSFGWLRKTFRTVADETKDFPAVDLIMGHAASDAVQAPFAVEMADRYRQRINPDRLRAVAEYVRQWLFGAPQQ